MGNFNFDVKRQTYESALKQTKSCFLEDDFDNGTYCLNKAIEVCSQLIENCIIDAVKQTYIAEFNKLKKIKANFVDKGINPFKVHKEEVKVTTPKGSNSENSEAKKDKDLGSSGLFQNEAPNVTLKDIAGLEDVKKEIHLKVLAPIKHPELFYQYNDKAGCQILLYGPPGCGKSFVAEAIAGELKCAYAVISAGDILDKYVGEAPKKIKQIFAEAAKYDNCLIFFDELDALFASRESDDSSHTKDVLTTFLTCLSGFNTSKDQKKIRVIIGATNRPWILDSAVLRGARFDTHIYVGLPDDEARRFLVNKAFKNKGSLLENTDIQIDDFVNLLDGYSCADIGSILDKIKEEAFSRALYKTETLEEGEKVEGVEPIKYEDATKVISNYRNSVTPDSIEAYMAFKDGEL